MIRASFFIIGSIGALNHLESMFSIEGDGRLIFLKNPELKTVVFNSGSL